MDLRRPSDIISDERGFIVGWLGKLAIGFVLVGIVIFDGGSILVNFFTLDSTADEIAVRLTTDMPPGSLSLTTLEPQARTLAQEAGARLVDIRIEDGVVYVTLRRRANTLIVGRIGPIEDWARATVEGQAGTG
jgi:hypothetical protein